ncbi:MAG: chromosomal replication initiator DnaA, partial [Rhodobacterales bacterium]
MIRQLTFDLTGSEALTRADFFVAPSNALALQAVEGWRDWPGRKLVLIGPEGSGKTHLVHVWVAMAGGVILPARSLAGQDIAALTGANVVVEDADQI